MNNEHRKQCQASPIPSTGKQLLLNEQEETHANNKADLYPSNSDDVYSRMKGDLNLHKRYAGELRPNGNSIVMTPVHDPRRQLPTEIVALILSQLDYDQHTLYQCALATRQFHSVANALLWQKLNFLYTLTNKSERFLRCISKVSTQQLSTLCEPIRELQLNDQQWTDTQLTNLLPYISRLKHLAIYPLTPITDESFIHVPYQCQRLTFLKLRRADLTLRSFSLIGQYCHDLVDFQWECDRDQSAEWLTCLAPCRLKTLEITELEVPLTKKAMVAIQHFEHLTYLRFEQTAPDHMNSFLLPQSITTTTMTSFCPQLNHLVLFPCDDIAESTIVEFIKSHPHLRTIDLEFAIQLSDIGLDEMVPWLPNLTRIALRYMDNADISPNGVRRFVSRSPPSLTHFELLGCEHVLYEKFPELLDHDDDDDDDDSQQQQYGGPPPTDEGIILCQSEIAKIRKVVKTATNIENQRQRRRQRRRQVLSLSTTSTS